MSRDIDAVLRSWEYEPNSVQARIVRVDPEREVVQLRLDLGLMQMELADRPDGHRPEGFPTYYAYLVHLAGRARRSGREFQLDEAQCSEADREFMQFYHRRVCFLALRQFERAVADADHTLAFMDLVRDHAPNDEVKMAHERYRPFVIFHKVQALAALYSEAGQPERAVDAVQDGLAALERHFEFHNLSERAESDPFAIQLKLIDQQLRAAHGIGATLSERLEEAVRREDYETAARLRDELRTRGDGGSGRTAGGSLP